MSTIGIGSFKWVYLLAVRFTKVQNKKMGVAEAVPDGAQESFLQTIVLA